MTEPNLKPIQGAIAKARAEADKLAQLLREELPDGAEIKDAWYALGLALRPALAEIRQFEAQGQLHYTSVNEFSGVG